MKFDVKYTESAEEDLDNIFEYIAEDNLEKAIEFTEELRKSANLLADFPFMGREREDEELLLINSRKKVYRNYIIYYSVIGGAVYIEHIQHGSKPLDLNLS